MTRFLHRLLAGVALVGTIAQPLSAATVLNDSFADGNSQNQALASNSVWLFNGRTGNTRTDAVGSASFAITSTSSEGFWAYFTDSGSPVTLGVGDRLTASFTFSVTGFTAGGQDIRGGLFNSAGTRNTANLTGGMNSSIFADDASYSFQFYASGTGSPFLAFKRATTGLTSANNPYNTMAATDWTQLTTGAAGASARTPLASSTSYTLTYSILRVDAANTEISIQVSGAGLPADYSYKATDVSAPITAFDCVAMRIGGSSFATGVTITNISVTTTPALPTITAQPSFTGGATSLTVGAGGQATLSVTASGQGLSYQWKKDGTDISGATSSSLALTNLQVADTGAYTVVVTNSAGSVTSAAASLTVTSGPVDPAPVINTHPASQAANNGTNVAFTVAVTGNNLAYQWKKNGVDIAGATGGTLNLSSVQASDAGSYTVAVSNGGGSVTSNAATLTVLSPTLTFSSFTPATSAAGLFPDTSLAITFGSAPTIGTTGTLRIYDAATDTAVDTIDLAAGTVGAGVSYLANTPHMTKTVGGQTFRYYPVTVSGNTATIYPRNGALTYGKTYYVRIDPGFFRDATGVNAGIADSTTWRFSTKASGPAGGTTALTVAADGSGDFLTIQGAIDFVPANNTTPTTIRIKNGTYRELVHFAGKHALTFVGETVDGVVLVYPNNNNLNNTGYRSVFYGNNVHDVVLANLTILNSTPQNGSQAEAIILKGSATTGKNMLNRVKLYSYQDTLQANGQLYVVDSYIEGDVDFLWGGGPAFFKNTQLHMLRTGGYYTQIRNPATNHGYVFANCRFTAAAGINSTYLGRIDPAVFPYSEVVLVDCAVGDVLNNAVLNTAVGASGSNYVAGWWLLNNVTTDATAGTIRYWDNATVDGTGAALTFAGRPAFTVMPTDATTLANYRDAVWVLNTAIDGTVNGAWTPAHLPLIVTQPTGASINSGTQASFSIATLAVPAPTYRWRKNGVDIPGATSATYTIAATVGGDAGNYSVVVTNSAGSVTSAEAALTVTTVGTPPSISTQPVTQSVRQGQPVMLSVVAAGDAPLAYQWQKSTDGVAFTNVAGATSASLSIAAALPGDAGIYRVEISNTAGSVVSSSATVTVNALGGATSPSGYAAAVTGGAAGTTVTVSNATDLRSYAESTNAHTIIVSGTIDLGASGRVRPKSNKTIKGADVTATILGTVEISNASNVILSNLNISANTGAAGDNDGVTIAASTNVLVTKCTIYDCTDGNLDVINGSDQVTISWCKFYYTRDNGHNFSNLVGSSDTDTGAGDGLTNYRVTWHHNWWSTGAKQRMIACRFGSAHMFNNYWSCSGNDYCTESRNIASMLSESNVYSGVDDPLGKRTALPTDVGLLMTIGNVFTSCTGNQLVSSDVVFVPPYSYEVDATGSLAAIVQAGAGNSAVDAPSWSSASINGTASAVAIGGSVTLTAVPAGFTPASYQWRFKNQTIAGATSATYTIAAAQAVDAGNYSVVLGLGGGDALVSTPFALAVNSTGVSISTPSTSATAGQGLTLTAAVAGVTPTAYQWQRDGLDIAGATSATLTLPHAQTYDAGTYRVIVTHTGGTLTSAGTPVSVSAAPASTAHVLNLSTRALSSTGESVMIPGFIIEGTGTKRMLIRAVGPTLTRFQVSGVLANPRMVLKRFDSGANAYVDFASNDDWGTAVNAAAIASTATDVGAFGLTSGSLDAALLTDLTPGRYTVVADGVDGGTGIALVELYDADASGSTARLINISNRGQVASGGQIMIPGFVVSSEGSRTFLIRAVGPGLASRGVAGALADPQLVLYRRNPDTNTDYAFLTNDDWGTGIGAATTATVSQQVGAFSLAAGSKDAAFVATLPPGLYTAHASGVGGATGVALVEVYLVP
jgi:pectate lyase/pectin methylesterase-like acyl-CoA thioesterase